MTKRTFSRSVVQHKTGTAAQWTEVNPTLAKGEIGVELDTNNLKIGDGVTAWNSLSYLIPTSLNLSAILLAAHPVGSYYWSDNDTGPGALFGGTWTQIKDRFILAAGDTYKTGTTDGEAAHILTEKELPEITPTGTVSDVPPHTHPFKYSKNDSAAYHGAGSNVGHLGGNGQSFNWELNTESAGGASLTFTGAPFGSGEAHNNMPPYVVAYCWKRTA